MNPTTAPPYCLEMVFRLEHREGKFRQSLVVSLSWEDRTKMPRQLDFLGQSTRDERAAQRKRSRDLHEVLLKSSAEY